MPHGTAPSGLQSRACTGEAMAMAMVRATMRDQICAQPQLHGVWQAARRRQTNSAAQVPCASCCAGCLHRRPGVSARARHKPELKPCPKGSMPATTHSRRIGRMAQAGMDERIGSPPRRAMPYVAIKGTMGVAREVSQCQGAVRETG